MEKYIKMQLYKVLGKDRQACHGDKGQWPVVGEWLEVKGENALYLIDREHLVEWINTEGEELYEAEFGGDYEKKEDMPGVYYGHKARLTRKFETYNDKAMWLFAADCAEHVLHLWHKFYPNDNRPQLAIQAIRNFAEDRISLEELLAIGAAARKAARAAGWAAGAAAGATAGAAAGAAGWAGGAAGAVAAAGWAADAAGWAAGWAAGAAMGKTARKKEMKWQTFRLFEYLEGFKS